MLEELIIYNIILVEKAHVRFHANMQIISGETGAGKSIIMQALRLLSGERLKSPNIIGQYGDMAEVTGIFDISHYEQVKQLCADNAISYDDNTLIIKRNINHQGKNRHYINDNPVTLSLLASITSDMIEIQGQHDQKFLYDKEKQRNLLDIYALEKADIVLCADAFNIYIQALNYYDNLQDKQEQFTRDKEYFTHILHELEQLDPKEHEETLLQDRRNILKQASQIDKASQELQHVISHHGYGGQESSPALLQGVLQGQKIAQKFTDIHQDWQKIYDDLEQVYYILDETLERVTTLQQECLGAADELDVIEERLFLLREHARKHKCTGDELYTKLITMQQQAAQYGDGDHAMNDAKEARDTAYVHYKEQADIIHHKRVSKAATLCGAVNALLPSLKLKGALFEIAITYDDAPHAHGCDKIMFMAQLNPSFPFVPVHQSASGGELSRLLLAIKVSFAANKDSPLLVFDEVDAGIGGSTARAVGRLLHRLSRQHQLLAITHSPQIAALSDRHFLVDKRTLETQAVTSIVTLNDTEKLHEIARMLSGEHITDEALAQAKKLCMHDDE